MVWRAAACYSRQVPGMENHGATALVVMARYPAVGEVKTRLARVIGADRACDLYRAFLCDIETRFAAGRRTLVWAYDPPDRDFAALLAPGARCLAQEGAALGARMRAVFRHLCASGFTRVLMFGADAPHVRDEWLDEAEAALDDADVALGPSLDGGYYLIGMRSPHDVFSGIKMGTPGVFAATRHKAEAAGLRVHVLPETFDVDEAPDLERLRERLRDADAAARLPATAACLRAWR